MFLFEKETQTPESMYELKELPVTVNNFPPANYVTKTLKNTIYEIPELILPPTRPYEIEVKFSFFLI
jgi:hypothetical protein